jgi:DNA adenine methylase
MTDFIKSPLNYTGNKSRLLSQILPLFPNNINRFVDLCCGGATVGLNATANSIICIDINRKVIDLLRTLKIYSTESIVGKIEAIIEKFNLSDTHKNGYTCYKDYVEGNNGFKKYNRDGYIELRKFFNTTIFDSYLEQSIYLYTLTAYCFNNDIRFNRNGKFNMPIGKTDFNTSIRKKLFSFKKGIERKNIDFITAEMNIAKELGLNSDDFLYVDPPYLITNAVYNEMHGWNEVYERELLSILDFLNNEGVRFALSNIIKKDGKENCILTEWIKDNNFKVNPISYHYRSASYNKINRNAKEQEVVITNYV